MPHLPESAYYIVVGAGSASCTLAARLSKDPACRVVLLEAGGEARNPWLRIPIGYGTTFHRGLSWNLRTEPELKGRRIVWPRSRVPGGSFAINGMLDLRGQPADFNHWRQLNCTGWSSSDMLPYLRWAEDQSRGVSALHGQGGSPGSR